MSKIFDDKWMQEQGYLEDGAPAWAPFSDVLDALGQREVVSTAPDEPGGGPRPST